MKKIFLIYANHSDYESCPELIGHKTSEDEAKEAIEDLKDEFKKATTFNDHICGLRRDFEKENESPLIRQNLIEFQKWPSGIGKDQITQEMRQERNDIIAKNQITMQENSKAYAEWQIKQMNYLKPSIDKVYDEPWFKKWFVVGERFINCKAYGLVEGHEFIYETSEEL